MNTVLKRCCGLDVHKSKVTACMLLGDLNEEPAKEIREFGTMTKDIHDLADWLKANDVKHVAMESTGVYWKPIFNILECEDIEVVLANAQHIKNVPGRKTDIKDAQWIAELFRNGLISASFIPPKNIRELRDLNRTRRKLVEEKTRIKNRIEKILQDSNIKLSSVISDIFGKSGLEMITKLTENNRFTEEEILEMARGQLKKKVAKIRDALEGNLSESNTLLLKLHFEHLVFLEDQIRTIDAEIDRRMEFFRGESELIQTIPGINNVSSSAIIAEIGADMSRFPDEKHLSSWAAICPGNNESAGKKKNGRTRRGNNYLKGILTECAWAASKTKDTSYSAYYHRMVRKKGKNRALVALAHKMLIDIYRVLKSGNPYVDKGIEINTEMDKKRVHSMIKQLVKRGYIVQRAEILVGNIE